jgi:hypothetical protein
MVIVCLLTWSGWPDLNRRPLRPEANARCGLPPLSPFLTCAPPSVDVLRRPLVFVAVVTQLVTHRPVRAWWQAPGIETASTAWNGPVQAADDRVDRLEAAKRWPRAGEEPGATIDVWIIGAE